MTFTTPEIAIFASFLFFAMLSLALFSYACGLREGRLAGMRQMFDHHQRKQREHEAQKRAWFQK